MKLLLNNWPASLDPYRDALVLCLQAMDHVMPVSEIILLGSHARGEARPDSDVDLCVVSVEAGEQLKARKLRQAMRPIRPKPPFTLIPISPQRLGEKKARGDHFFQSVLSEGVLLASKN